MPFTTRTDALSWWADAAVGLSDHQSKQGMSVVTDMKRLQKVMSLEAAPKQGEASSGSGSSAEAAAKSGSEGGACLHS